MQAMQKGLPGATLIVGIDEPDGAAVAWLVVVEGLVGAEFLEAGRMVSVPPAVSGKQGRRVLALASLPGVADWRVTATPSLPGAPGALVLESSSQGPPNLGLQDIDVGPSAGPVISSYLVPFSFASPSPLAIAPFVPGNTLIRATVQTGVIFNDPAASATLGTATSLSLSLGAADINLGAVSEETSLALIQATGPQALSLFLSPAASSQGSGLVFLQIRG